MWSVLKFAMVILIACVAVEVHSEDLKCHVCNPCRDETDWTSEFCPPQPITTESTTLKTAGSVKEIQTGAETDPSYHCFRISRKVPENGTLIFQRGCIKVAYDAAACDVLAHDGELASCKVCGRSLCNAAAAILFQVSALLLILGGLLLVKAI